MEPPEADAQPPAATLGPTVVELPGSATAAHLASGEGCVVVMTSEGLLLRVVPAPPEEDGKIYRVVPVEGQPDVPVPPPKPAAVSLFGEPPLAPPGGLLAVAAGRVARIRGSEASLVPGGGVVCCGMDLDALTVRLEGCFRTFRLADGHCSHVAREEVMLPEGGAAAVAVQPGAKGVWAYYPKRGCIELCVEEEPPAHTSDGTSSLLHPATALPPLLGPEGECVTVGTHEVCGRLSPLADSAPSPDLGVHCRRRSPCLRCSRQLSREGSPLDSQGSTEPP